MSTESMTHAIRMAGACALGFALVGCIEGKVEQRSTSAEQTMQLCVSCHGDALEGKAEVNAPAIAGLPQWYVERQLGKFRNGSRGGHFDDHAGMQMRPMALSLTDEDVTTIAAHVATLPPATPAPTLEGGDATRGQTLYVPCSACHGANAAGDEKQNAPPLTATNDWYLLTQLRHFKDGVRGANPLDIEGAGMRPMASTLVDEQAMKDVVAYVATLR